MELEELQAAWTQMSTDLEHQKKMTDEIIIDMTKEKYKNKFKTLITYESFGVLICIAYAFFLLYNFSKLDTWYLVTFGILALLFSLILPFLGMKFLFEIKNIDILKGDYQQNILKYTKAKNNLLALQQFAIIAGFAMFFLIIAVNSKIVSGTDIFQSELTTGKWIGILGGLTFMVFFCRWGYRSYQKVTASAASILKELE